MNAKLPDPPRRPRGDGVRSPRTGPSAPVGGVRGARLPWLPVLEAAATGGTPAGEGCAPASSPAGPNVPEGGAAGEGRSRPPGANPVADAMSENELEQYMRRILADLPGVLAYHTFNSQRSRAGFPDWVFCGVSGVLFRELKREGKKPTPPQAEWLVALQRAGQNAGVWRP